MQKFEVDDLFTKEDKLVGDDQIRSLLRAGRTQGQNPNPEKFKEVEIKFTQHRKSVLEEVLRNIHKFEYDPLEQGK